MEGLIGKLFVQGYIVLETGLHIGGSTESMDIGGIDTPILRSIENIPFIPGSSLKGKIRSLLEWKDGKFTINFNEETFNNISEFWDEYRKSSEAKNIKGEPCKCGKCRICRLFGVPAQTNSLSPTRLIVRDALLDVDSFKETFKDSELLDRDYGEIKFENTIDRITSTANPRQIERVPAGAKFKFHFIINLLAERDEESVKTLFEGMRLLEDDYLGGSGTRGYGKVKFTDITITLRDKKYYETGEINQENIKRINDLSENNINNIIKSLIPKQNSDNQKEGETT